MLTRLYNYLQEMFPLHLNVPIGFISFFTPYFLARFLIEETQQTKHFLVFQPQFICGGLTIVFIMLLLRVMDELKDYEVDKKLFKQRPLITGTVQINDLYFFMIVLTVSLLLLNVFLNKIILFTFLFMLLYAYLMYKYFFYPKIAASLPLALITHNPIAGVMQAYILSYIIAEYGIIVFNWDFVLIIILFWFPYLAWELGRKIRKPSEETEYNTYSKIMGLKNACFSYVLVNLIIGGIFSYFIYKLQLSYILLAFFWIIILSIVSKILLYLRTPYPIPVGFRLEAEIVISFVNIGLCAALLARGWL